MAVTEEALEEALRLVRADSANRTDAHGKRGEHNAVDQLEHLCSKEGALLQQLGRVLEAAASANAKGAINKRTCTWLVENGAQISTSARRTLASKQDLLAELDSAASRVGEGEVAAGGEEGVESAAASAAPQPEPINLESEQALVVGGGGGEAAGRTKRTLEEKSEESASASESDQSESEEAPKKKPAAKRKPAAKKAPTTGREGAGGEGEGSSPQRKSRAAGESSSSGAAANGGGTAANAAAAVNKYRVTQYAKPVTWNGRFSVSPILGDALFTAHASELTALMNDIWCDWKKMCSYEDAPSNMAAHAFNLLDKEVDIEKANTGFMVSDGLFNLKQAVGARGSEIILMTQLHLLPGLTDDQKKDFLFGRPKGGGKGHRPDELWARRPCKGVTRVTVLRCGNKLHAKEAQQVLHDPKTELLAVKENKRGRAERYSAALQRLTGKVVPLLVCAWYGDAVGSPHERQLVLMACPLYKGV